MKNIALVTNAKNKLFHIDVTPSTNSEEIIIVDTIEVEISNHTTPTQEIVEYKIPQEDPIISLHALVGISTPQTLKLLGYIKLHKVVVLVDDGSTHNFIHKKIVDETHYYVHLVSNFQIMIANGGMMPCWGRCENVRLKLGDYHHKTHMFAIDMGGCDIVLRVGWLGTLGLVTMDFKELYLSFTQNSHTHMLKGLQEGSPEIISSHRMENLFKKYHLGVVAQFNSIQVLEKPA